MPYGFSTTIDKQIEFQNQSNYQLQKLVEFSKKVTE